MHLRSIRAAAFALAALNVLAAYAFHPALSYVLLIVGLALFVATVKQRRNPVWAKILTGCLLAITPLIGAYQTIQPGAWQLAITGLFTLSTFFGATGLLIVKFNQKPDESRTRIIGWWIAGIFGLTIPTLGFGTAAIGFLACLMCAGMPFTVFGLIMTVAHLAEE